MLQKNTSRYGNVSRTIDNFMKLDYTGVGLIDKLYEALQTRQPGPCCMGAAERLVAAAKAKPGSPILIATGFPEGGGVPETDGPVGAALLARALFLGLGVISVIVVDEDWEGMMNATCMGAGLAPRPLPASGQASSIEFLRPVYIKTVPKDSVGCHRACEEILDITQPSLLLSIERPGCNANGLYHGLGGRPLDGMVADLDYLFRQAKQRKLPTIGIGDGGNELGMGVIAEDLPKFSPKAVDCGIPGRGGVGAATATDWLVVSNVSNWGATGIIAAMSALLENPVVFHDPELETRATEACVANGGVDGMFMGPEPANDGIVIREWEGMVRSLRSTVLRTMGHSVNWKGDQGDWRQLK
jgi:hypothetical protein